MKLLPSVVRKDQQLTPSSLVASWLVCVHKNLIADLGRMSSGGSVEPMGHTVGSSCKKVVCVRGCKLNLMVSLTRSRKAT